MPTLRSALLLTFVLAILEGCGSSSPRDLKEPHPHLEPGPENPLVFNLDLSTPLPLLSLTATAEEASKLRTLYTSFFVEMGSPQKGGVLSLRFDKKGSLGNPWNFYLRNFSPPYPVRLLGILPDGKKEVIHEETYQ